MFGSQFFRYGEWWQSGILFFGDGMERSRRLLADVWASSHALVPGGGTEAGLVHLSKRLITDWNFPVGVMDRSCALACGGASKSRSNRLPSVDSGQRSPNWF